MRHLAVTVRKAKDIAILDLTGPLIAGQPAQAFYDQIVELLDTGIKNLAVNLAGVSYIDSSGVGVLGRAHVSITAIGANWKLFGAPAKILGLFKMAMLDQVFDFHEDEVSALSSF